MSFSSDLKKEILDNFKTSNKCCINAERFGEMITQVKYKNDVDKELREYFDISLLEECCISSIIKGAYLSSGYIVDPNKDYSIEITFKNKACMEYLLNLLSVLEFSPRSSKREKTKLYVIYIKDSEQISMLLSLMSASKSKLNFEEIRVLKEVKNNINRGVNCEMANLNKTISASLKQIEAINILRQKGIFESLNENLKTTAKLRENNPDDSLDQLVLKFPKDKKITKSGLKHRLDKLIDIANEN